MAIKHENTPAVRFQHKVLQEYCKAMFPVLQLQEEPTATEVSGELFPATPKYYQIILNSAPYCQP